MVVLYKLEVFEGPLDLLLHLIEQNEVDIYNIPITSITDQYMAYLETLKTFELEPTSEFLIMAAQLLAIKSQMLLPKPPPVELEYELDEGEDPRAELVRKLIEFRKFKEVANQLRERELDRSLVFTKEPEDLSEFEDQLPVNPVKGIQIADLMVAFGRVMQQVAKKNEVTRIQRDEISVKERIGQVLNQLKLNKGKILFSALFEHEESNKADIVITFLAILELMKGKQIRCYQHGAFEEIVIHGQTTEAPDGFLPTFLE